jgi:hypothetical protein
MNEIEYENDFCILQLEISVEAVNKLILESNIELLNL